MQKNAVVTARPRSSTRLLALLGALAIAVLLAFSAEHASAAKVVADYCSPTGDYCTTIKKKGDNFILAIESFAFFGPYQLCVKPKNESKVCHDLVIDEQADDAGLYRDKANWAKTFPSDSGGVHKVTWFLEGDKLGPSLNFTP